MSRLALHRIAPRQPAQFASTIPSLLHHLTKAHLPRLFAALWDSDVKVVATLWRCFKTDRHINIGTVILAEPGNFASHPRSRCDPFGVFLDIVTLILDTEASTKDASNLLSRIAVNLPSKPRIVVAESLDERFVGSGLCSSAVGLANLGALLLTILRSVLSRPLQDQSRLYIRTAGLDTDSVDGPLRLRVVESVTDYLVNKRADFALSASRSRQILIHDAFSLLAMLQVRGRACRLVLAGPLLDALFI